MSLRFSSVWLPRLLFTGTLLVSALLTGLVFLAPVIHDQVGVLEWRPLELFASDATLRRTALASAIGLAVTGFVFFRPTSTGKSALRKAARVPPRHIAGA